jgi:hypothetical protein
MLPGRTPPPWARVLVTLVVLVTVAFPALRGTDSFPLSNYPMFANPRATTSTVDLARGLTPSGAAVTLDPSALSGTDQIIQAARTITREIQAGDADALCAEIAARVVERQRSGAWPDVERIEVATETHNVVEWFESSRDPLTRTVHATCDLVAP